MPIILITNFKLEANNILIYKFELLNAALENPIESPSKIISS